METVEQSPAREASLEALIETELLRVESLPGRRLLHGFHGVPSSPDGWRRPNTLSAVSCLSIRTS